MGFERGAHAMGRGTLRQQVEMQRHGVATMMLLGPTESLVIADSTADPYRLAADLLVEAEHGTDTSVVLVCTDAAVATNVQLGRITSSPSPIPVANSAISIECDPFVTATAGPVPWNAPHRPSNSRTFVPCDDHHWFESSTSSRFDRSWSSCTGHSGYGAVRTGIPP